MFFFFVLFCVQQNIPVLLQGHSAAEMITFVFAQTKSAIKWMTAVTSRTRRSAVSAACTVITYTAVKKCQNKVSQCSLHLSGGFFFLRSYTTLQDRENKC